MLRKYRAIKMWVERGFLINLGEGPLRSRGTNFFVPKVINQPSVVVRTDGLPWKTPQLPSYLTPARRAAGCQK
jgi:hypothetical protein